MAGQVRVPMAHRSPVRGIAAVTTPDGRGLILTAGGDDMIRSWDATTGEPGRVRVPIAGVRVTFMGVAGGILVCADTTAIHRFDLSTGERIGTPLRAPGSEWLPVGGLGPVAMLPGEESIVLVAGGAGGRLHRWDARTGERAGQPWTAHDGKVLAVAALRSRAGRALVVSGGTDGLVRRWDAGTGEPAGPPLAGPERPVIAFAYAPGAGILFGQEWRGPIHRWDADTGEPAGRPLRRAGLGDGEGGCAVTPDGRVLISADHAGVPWRWDLTDAEPVAEPFAAAATVATQVAVAPSAGGWIVVTGGEDGRLRRWDPAGRPAGGDLSGHPARVSSLVAVPGDPEVLVSAGRDGLRAWTASTGEPAGKAPGALPAGDGLAAVALPDGRLIAASGTDRGILRCDVLSGAVEEPDDEDGGVVSAVAAGRLPDGRPFFAGASSTGRIHLVDAATGAALGKPLRALRSQALAVAATTLPGGTTLVAGGGEDRRILRWNAVTGEPVGTPLRAGTFMVMSLAFHVLPGDRVLLSAVDDAGDVRRWDAVTGEPLGEVLSAGGAGGEAGPAGGEAGLAAQLAGVAPQRLLAVARDDVLRCWDVLTGRHLGDLPDAASAALTGGRLLAVGHTDGSITVDPL